MISGWGKEAGKLTGPTFEKPCASGGVQAFPKAMKATTHYLRTLTLTATLGGLFATSALPAEAVQLFNGQNLRGWQAYLAEHGVTRQQVWSVQDGILICKGEPLGYLYTARPHENFKLVVEWRWAPGGEPGNSGVLMRINGEPRPLPRGLEAQLKSGDAGALYGFHGMAVDGDADRKIDSEGSPFTGRIQGVRKTKGNEKPPGEWNRYDITLNGGNLTVLVNGEKVNEATGCEVLAGPIGLQSEGGEIHFRKVELTPIE